MSVEPTATTERFNELLSRFTYMENLKRKILTLGQDYPFW
jgi:hypothetical protein